MSTYSENSIQNIVKQFQPISLSEMDSVSLMKRTDTKYVFHYKNLESILTHAAKEYRILEIEDLRTIPYVTVYYDTPNYAMYHGHHNGKLHRYKIRHRKYAQSGLTFLECKQKDNKGVTNKKRIIQEAFDLDSAKNSAFLSERSPYKQEDLKPAMYTYFTRLTLVHKTVPERITLDIKLEFKDAVTSRQHINPNLCIAEVKKDAEQHFSPFINILRMHRINPMGFSKYCMGMALLNTQVKKNLFKPRIRQVEKITL